MQRQLLDEGSNEQTLTANLLAIVVRERGRSCMGVDNARHREAGGGDFCLFLAKDPERGLSVIF